jgi:hypothetical protein
MKSIDQAHKLKLTYLGWGKWGNKSGRVVAKTVDDKLNKKNKIIPITKSFKIKKYVKSSYIQFIKHVRSGNIKSEREIRNDVASTTNLKNISDKRCKTLLQFWQHDAVTISGIISNLPSTKAASKTIRDYVKIIDDNKISNVEYVYRGINLPNNDDIIYENFKKIFSSSSYIKIPPAGFSLMPDIATDILDSNRTLIIKIKSNNNKEISGIYLNNLKKIVNPSNTEYIYEHEVIKNHKKPLKVLKLEEHHTGKNEKTLIITLKELD